MRWRTSLSSVILAALGLLLVGVLAQIGTAQYGGGPNKAQLPSGRDHPKPLP